jgi:hypothetical protein
VFGGQLLKSQVGADADWVAHVNYDQIAKSKLGGLIRAELAKKGLEEKLQAFQTIFSFHPIDDVRDVTIYGSGEDRDKAVAIFEGAFDSAKLVALVQMNPEYKEIKQGDVVVHSWVDENKRDPNGPGQRMYGCIYTSDTVVLGSGLETVKQAVDVLSGSAPNAEAAGIFKQAVLSAEGAFFQVAANSVSELANHHHRAALLKKTDELGAVIGENDGQFYINLSLGAESEEVAGNVKKMIEGMIAFMTIAAGSEHPGLGELARKLDISNVDRTITIYFESTPESVFAFLKEIWQKKRNR